MRLSAVGPSFLLPALNVLRILTSFHIYEILFCERLARDRIGPILLYHAVSVRSSDSRLLGRWY